jgi:hypothetical protein
MVHVAAKTFGQLPKNRHCVNLAKTFNSPMQLTDQLRLYDLSPETLLILDALGDYHGRMLRKLYAYVAKHGGTAKRHKTAFCQLHGISARFFNALRTELDGLIDGTTELLTARCNDLEKEVRALNAKLRRLDKFFEQIMLNRLEVTTKLFRSKTAQQAHARNRLTRAEQKLQSVKIRLEANVPGIGFGSRKLFLKQFNLKENGYRSRGPGPFGSRVCAVHEAA